MSPVLAEIPFPWAPVAATLLCGALTVWRLALGPAPDDAGAERDAAEGRPPGDRSEPGDVR